MSDTPPQGWFPDPMGRAPERLWDGSAWTDRVRDGLVEWDDPLQPSAGSGVAQTAAASTSAGQSTATQAVVDDPAASTATPATPAVDPLRSGPVRPGLEAHLKRARPSVDVAAAVSAAAGVVGVIGAYVAVSDVEGTAGTAVMSIVLLAIAYALALVGPPVARGAALVAGVVAPLGIAGLLAENLDGRTSAVVPILLLVGVWTAMFLLPGLRGAPVLIAGIAQGTWAALVTMTGGPGEYGLVSVDAGPWVGSEVDPFAAMSADIEQAGALSLVFALGLAVAAAVLDRKGWHVAATPLIAVSAVLGVTGMWLAASSGSFAGSGTDDGFLLLLVGVVLAVVGALGSRRGSTWIGVGLALTGLVVLLASSIQDPIPAGIVLLVLAAGILAAAGPVARKLAAGETSTIV